MAKSFITAGSVDQRAALYLLRNTGRLECAACGQVHEYMGMGRCKPVAMPGYVLLNWPTTPHLNGAQRGYIRDLLANAEPEPLEPGDRRELSGIFDVTKDDSLYERGASGGE